MTELRPTTLGELLQDTGSIKTGPFGTTLKASEYSESGVPVISVGEVGYGNLQLRRDTPKVSSNTTSRLPEYVLEHGDIVFGRKGAVDRSAFVHPEQEGWFLGSDGIRVRVPDNVNARFIAYQLQSLVTRDWLLRHASGSTMLSLNQKILERVPLVVPSKCDQQAISEVLGALDDKIVANARSTTVIDDLSSTMVEHALQAGACRPLSEVAELTMGSSPKGSTLNEAGIGTVFYQGIRDFGMRYPSNRVWTSDPIRLAKPMDTLLSVRAPVGQANLSTEPTCIGRGVAAARSRHRTPYTLFHELRLAENAWGPFNSEGTVFGSINKSQLASVELAVVPLESRCQLESKLTFVEGLLKGLLNENALLASLRDTLLPQLMSGKLHVKDAEKVVEEVVL